MANTSIAELLLEMLVPLRGNLGREMAQWLSIRHVHTAHLPGSNIILFGLNQIGGIHT